MRRVSIAALAGVLAVAGCQSSLVPLAGPGANSAGRRFGAPPPGMGAVQY